MRCLDEMNIQKLEQIFMEDVLPQLQKKHKVLDIEKCKAIFIEIGKSSIGPKPKGLRESALPKSLRPGYNYMKRLLTETDAVEIKKRPADGWYYVDPINNKVYFSHERWSITQKYFDRLRSHINEDPSARQELAKAFSLKPEQVDNLITDIINKRDLDLFNKCVDVLLGKFDLRSRKYGFLNWRPGAQYLKLSDFHRKLMED
jgi:hypothetical protein